MAKQLMVENDIDFDDVLVAGRCAIEFTDQVIVAGRPEKPRLTFPTTLPAG